MDFALERKFVKVSVVFDFYFILFFLSRKRKGVLYFWISFITKNRIFEKNC